MVPIARVCAYYCTELSGPLSRRASDRALTAASPCPPHQECFLPGRTFVAVMHLSEFSLISSMSPIFGVVDVAGSHSPGDTCEWRQAQPNPAETPPTAFKATQSLVTYR